MPGLTDGVATEVRRVDVPRRRGVVDVPDSITDGLMATCSDGPAPVDVVDKATGRMRLRITPV